MAVTVITPSLPHRDRMLERARASVLNQSKPPAEHLIGVDYQEAGPAQMRNRLASIATTKWLAFLDDDDHLDRDHLEILTGFGRTADIVYSNCRFDGPPLPDEHLPRPFDRSYLRERGFIPITFLVRRETFEQVGGFPLEARYEDWEFLNNAADAGARFQFVDQVTWTYVTGHEARRTNL